MNDTVRGQARTGSNIVLENQTQAGSAPGTFNRPPPYKDPPVYNVGNKNLLGEPAPAKDVINHPKHYTAHPSSIECIDVTEHMNFNLGNAVKYIWRVGLKDTEEENIRKAIWYLNRELKRRGIQE
jgi:hypothetical protein